MYDYKQLTNQQGIADALKKLIDRTAGSDTDRKKAINAVSFFEQGKWIPLAFEDAMQEAPLAFDGDFSLMSDATVTAYQAVIQLLGHYQMLVLPYDQPLGIEGAATYLGLTLRGMKRLKHETHEIEGELLDGKLVFTRQELDGYRHRKITAVYAVAATLKKLVNAIPDSRLRTDILKILENIEAGQYDDVK